VIEKNIDAFRTISEVAEDLDLPQHVLRFWETRFTQIKPLKRGGGRRYYRPDDVELLRAIRQLLYGEGYTIKGVQRILKEQGPKAVAAAASGKAAPPQEPPRLAPSLPIEADAAVAPQATIVRAESRAVETRPAPKPTSQHSLFAEPVLPAPPAAPIRASAAASLSATDLHRLRAALADLAECERILAAARRV